LEKGGEEWLETAFVGGRDEQTLDEVVDDGGVGGGEY